MGRGKRARTIRRRAEPPMMGVKCSAKKRPRSRRTVPFCLSRCFARRSLCILRTEVGSIRGSLRGPHGEPGRVYSARNTQDARNYGLSIISYASRYLLNIVPAYFSGEFACRGKRVSSKGGRGAKTAGAVPFSPRGFRHGSACEDCIVRADTETGSCRNSTSRKSRPQTFACSKNAARRINRRITRARYFSISPHLSVY